MSCLNNVCDTNVFAANTLTKSAAKFHTLSYKFELGWSLLSFIHHVTGLELHKLRYPQMPHTREEAYAAALHFVAWLEELGVLA
jgi:hypothetical protein